ncbi:MAG: sugar phosphate isomerase/epimerase family protein [Spirochaetia bacterium]
MPGYRYRLTVQTVLPERYEDDAEFRARLEMLRDLGFWGLELNVADPEAADFERISRYIGEFGLSFSMFASGLTAKTFGLSLSEADEATRRKSVEKAKAMIDFVSPNPECGIIFGFLKGPKVDDVFAAVKQFRSSMDVLVPYAAERGVMLVVEATNRYEAALANGLDDTVALVDGYPAETVKILPDTFHMNIEEQSMVASLARYHGRYVSVHYSDNNRYFPGFGGIDFAAVTAYLDAVGFDGRIGLEANVKDSFESDVRASVRRLAPILE